MTNRDKGSCRDPTIKILSRDRRVNQNHSTIPQSLDPGTRERSTLHWHQSADDLDLRHASTCMGSNSDSSIQEIVRRDAASHGDSDSVELVAEGPRVASPAPPSSSDDVLIREPEQIAVEEPPSGEATSPQAGTP